MEVLGMQCFDNLKKVNEANKEYFKVFAHKYCNLLSIILQY
jgi:hypothetical protein